MHLNIVRPMFLLAVVLLFIAANAMWGSAAQNVTPASHAVHPIVGSWVLSSNADIPPSVYTFGADGAVGTSVDGTRHGAWRATGDRTVQVTAIGLEGAGALVTVYAEISLDATGEGLEVPYFIEPEPEGGFNPIMGPNVVTGARIETESVGPIEMSPFASPAPMSPEAAGSRRRAIMLFGHRAKGSLRFSPKGSPYTLRGSARTICASVTQA